MSVSGAIKDLIARRIRAEGPICFARYMELALYSDPMGYYRRNVPGRGGSYRTSPTLSPAFGRLVARQLETMWEALGRPDPFRVTETGGGSGDLALSALAYASPALAGALKWCIVEPFPSVARVQAETLRGLSGLRSAAFAGRSRIGQLQPQSGTGSTGIEWSSGLDDLPPADGVMLANEVVDNMPFHVLEVAAGSLNEVYIGLEGDRLVEVPFEVGADSPLGELAGEALEHLEPGDRLEVRPAAADWCRLASGALRRGYLLVVDYGDTEPEIWTRHPSGTVATYRGEQLGFDPLIDPGETDITAHVNFSALSRAASQAGMSVAAPVKQRDWLRSLGLPEIEQALRQEQLLAEQRGDHATALSLLGERSRAAALAFKAGLGDLIVWIAAKDVPLTTNFS